MAPSKSRAAGDDHKADTAAGSKEKNNEGKPAPAKMRRGASQNSASQIRESSAIAPTSAPSRNAPESHAPSVRFRSLIFFFSPSSPCAATSLSLINTNLGE